MASEIDYVISDGKFAGREALRKGIDIGFITPNKNLVLGGGVGLYEVGYGISSVNPRAKESAISLKALSASYIGIKIGVIGDGGIKIKFILNNDNSQNK